MNNIKRSTCCNSTVVYVSHNPELSDETDFWKCEKCGKECEVIEIKEQCVGDEAI